jgi:hypothetical protein
MKNDHVFAFEDINPQAPTHVLVIPKKHFAGLKEAEADDAEIIGRCHLAAAEIARQRNIEQGYRTVFNVGPGRGAVSVSSSRAFTRRALAGLAPGIGQGRYCTVGFSSSGAPCRRNNCGKVLRERGTRQHHVAAHFVSFLLQIPLHMRKESDDRGSLLQLRLQLGDQRERLGVGVVEIER